MTDQYQPAPARDAISDRIPTIRLPARGWNGFLVGVAGGGLVALGLLFGIVWSAGGHSRGVALPTPGAQLSIAERLGIPADRLQASAADSGTSFAIATGMIDDDAEGLFLLDYTTGELQCVVLNHRFGKFNAIYRTNVMNDLGVDNTKRPEYLMVTGLVNFPRGITPARPARSAIYVVDGNTGLYVAYGVPWVQQANQVGRPQMGGLIRLDAGMARLPISN